MRSWLSKIKKSLLINFYHGKSISFFATVKNSKLFEFVQITARCNVVNSKIGRYTSIGRNTNVYYSEIGSFCSISWNVTIGAPNHPIDHISTHAFPYVHQFDFVGKNKKHTVTTKVGNDVWIGANSIVLPGLKIGDGSIIGAGSVVTKDVPPFAIVVGNPGKIIRYRFSNEIIEKIADLKWWDWPKEKIRKHILEFHKLASIDNLNNIK